MIFHNASIKQKLESIILITAATVLLLSLVVFMASEIISAREETGARLKTLATVLGANSSAAITFRDRHTAQEILTTLATQDDILWAHIHLANGQVFAEYLSEQLQGAAHEVLPSGERKILIGQVEVNEPIKVDGETIGHFHIVGDMRRAQEVLRKQTLLGLGVFVISMFIALLLSSRLQRVVSVPVRRLLDTMQRVTAQRDFSQRAERSSNDELGTLVDGFNTMLEQIQADDRELTAYRQDLERLVDERTHELERAKIAAEAASQAKSDFLATMSHEIRTPMNAVLGFTSLLEKSELSEKQLKYLHNINTSAESLLTIINDILDFSKMESGMLNLECTDFLLSAVVDEVGDTLRPKAREKGLKLSTGIDDELPCTLRGDPVRLRQILLNLVGNAVKFTEQGEVSLHLERTEASEGKIGLRISVRDTGIGITAKQKAQLFQAFQQGDSSITRRYGGTGLGLVITQRLVSLLGGRITLSSTPGEGSTFTVVVQMEPAAESPPPPQQGDSDTAAATSSEAAQRAKQAQDALQGLTILVVDDNPLNLTVASTLLSNEGAEVVAVSGGAEALAQVEARGFDLVLMDLEMPGMSGLEAASKIRQLQSEASSLPIIAVTAHAFPQVRGEVLEAGMNDMLTKPYKPEQLNAMIAKWCHHQEVAALPTEEEPAAGAESVYDREAAVAAVAGDEATAELLRKEFIRLLPESRAAIHDAHAAREYRTLYEAVHKLAGSASVVGATRLHSKTRSLQQLLKQEPLALEQVDEGVAGVLAECSRFEELFAA